eukprot:gb/GECG01002041.1/.p1 GENE.gb/GECG01002041.1/~~gb/GECG01002041.1/.p1  ORF type:complete len:274 (+),score=15.30 gb/GECG01002041.1/:1-822(+)
MVGGELAMKRCSLGCLVVLVLAAESLGVRAHDFRFSKVGSLRGALRDIRSLRWSPPTYNQTVVEAFWNKILLNPMPPLEKDPYQIPNFNTTWNDSVCAVKYAQDKVTGKEDRHRYYLYTYRNPQDAVNDNAYVTHLHPCGYCSTTKDLAIYMNYTDLTNPVRICGALATFSQPLAMECLEKIGFTTQCSKIWMYDAINTRKECWPPCIKDWIEGVPNNVPPNSTNLNPCLECDETKSGPIFKVVAGRTRRDSGLESSINRPPSSIYNITHYYY